MILCSGTHFFFFFVPCATEQKETQTHIRVIWKIVEEDTRIGLWVFFARCFVKKKYVCICG